MLVDSVMLLIYQLSAMTGDGDGQLALTSAQRLLTFLLPAAVWLAAFYSAQQNLRN